LFIKTLVLIPSVLTIGFGLWHFFVPKVWKWYSYIDKSATELVLAVRAINVFFSLSLVIFGALNLIFLYRKPHDLFALKVVLGVSCLLWAGRVAMQIIYPQGTTNPYLNYGMTTAFIVIFTLYTVSLILLFVGA
jgi:hypothetical protein